VFFDSPDALVAQDVDGVRDVYEWEDGKVFLVSAGTGSLNSYYLDNTVSGNDVFFTTADGLFSSDTDGGYDVYDARVGGKGEAVATGGCVSNCQSPPSTPPAFSVPLSVTFSGPGTVFPSTGAQKAAPPKKKAVKKKKKKKKVKKKRKGKKAGRAGVGVGSGRGRGGRS
jgi:hypothetical protein